MYKRTKKYQQKVDQSTLFRMQKEHVKLQVDDLEAPHDLPHLRRTIVITDYDFGEPIVHKIELIRCDRIDCYDAYVDGKLWRKRIGWSRILNGIRKALPRLRQL